MALLKHVFFVRISYFLTVFYVFTLRSALKTNLEPCFQTLNPPFIHLTLIQFDSDKMNSQIQQDDITIADQLLKQLEDQYIAVLNQNFTMPKQNIEPQQDPENPYQPLEFDDQDDNQSDNPDFESNQHEQEPGQSKAAQDVMEEISKMQISQTQSNPQIKELIEVPPTSDEIYTNLPHKQFNIDEEKIKTFALSMEIDQPEWLKDQNLCKTRIQQLFNKKSPKPFTKI